MPSHVTDELRELMSQYSNHIGRGNLIPANDTMMSILFFVEDQIVKMDAALRALQMKMSALEDVQTNAPVPVPVPPPAPVVVQESDAAPDKAKKATPSVKQPTKTTKG